MTTERLRAELLLILSPVRERRIWRCLLRDDNERKAGPLFLARQRSFAENRTKPGWRSSDRHPASALPRLQMVPRSQIGRSHTPPPRFAIRDRQSKLDDSQGAKLSWKSASFPTWKSGVRIPLPPGFRRGVEEREVCRAAAFVKADNLPGRRVNRDT